jgi:hypothetical protein
MKACFPSLLFLFDICQVFILAALNKTYIYIFYLVVQKMVYDIIKGQNRFSFLKTSYLF